MKYDFANIEVRPELTLADVNNKYIFGDTKHVINVSNRINEEVKNAIKSKGASYISFPLEEEPKMDWFKLLEAARKIRDYLPDLGHIIVHCIGGNNRSRTVVELFYYLSTGKHIDDEYKGCKNHLLYNVENGFLDKSILNASLRQEEYVLLDDIEGDCCDYRLYKVYKPDGTICYEKTEWEPDDWYGRGHSRGFIDAKSTLEAKDIYLISMSKILNKTIDQIIHDELEYYKERYEPVNKKEQEQEQMQELLSFCPVISLTDRTIKNQIEDSLGTKLKQVFTYTLKRNESDSCFFAVETQSLNKILREARGRIDESVFFKLDEEGLHINGNLVSYLVASPTGRITVPFGLFSTYQQYQSDVIEITTSEYLVLITGYQIESTDETLITNDDCNTEEEIDDNTETCDNKPEHTAKYLEMKAEAIKRMKSLNMYEYIIDDFEETDEPQVYEPPTGASYYLENDELSYVRKLEAENDILIWGVIRCSMNYNRQPENVDCYLYVSNHKGWKEEREMLLNGTPHVITYMKSQDLRDYGTINIQMSAGGTPLRVFRNSIFQL